MGRVAITTWRLRPTRLTRKTITACIAVPDRLPKETSLGALAGITNITRANKLTRPTRRPILGGIGKMAKMVQPVGAQGEW